MEAEEFEQQLQEIFGEQSPKSALYKLADLYVVVSEEQRGEIREDFDFGREWEYPDQMMLAAHLPDEPDREARIRASIISLSLIDMGDDRDIIVALCPIYHSIKALGKDVDAWFRFFADMSSPLMASHLFKFAARTPEDKSLAAFWLESDVTEQGLVFKSRPG